MQFFQLTTIIALAASAAAGVVPAEAPGTASNVPFTGGLQACRDDSGNCRWGSPSTCSSNGWGEPYACQTAGIINGLNCFSLLNGNNINVNVLDFLNN